MTAKIQTVALFALIAITFAACPQTDTEPLVEYRNSVEYTAAGTGPLSLVVDGVNLNLDVDENGNISLEFPEAARNFARKRQTLAMSAEIAQKLYENRAQAVISIPPPPPPPPIELGVITQADKDAIVSWLKVQCAALVSLVTTKYVDGAAQPNPETSRPEVSSFTWTVNCGLTTVTEYPQTSTQVSLNVTQAIGNGKDTSFIDSSWKLTVTAQGFSLNFPRGGRDIATTFPANALNIAQADLQNLFQGKPLSFRPAFRFQLVTTDEKSSYLSETDRDIIVSYIQDALQSALGQVRKHYLNDAPDTSRLDEYDSLAVPVLFAAPETDGFIILRGEETYMNHDKATSESDWRSPEAAAIGSGGTQFINDDWALTVSAEGMSIKFPRSGRNVEEAAMTLNIPRADVQTLIDGKTWPYAAGDNRIALTLKAGADNGYITTADRQLIQNYLAGELKKAVSRKIDGSRTDRDGVAMTPLEQRIEHLQGLELTHTLDPGLTEKTMYPVEGTLWGNTAFWDRSGNTVTIEVLHKDGGALNASGLFDSPNTDWAGVTEVVVEFTRSASGTGADRISFGKITELMLAIKQKTGLTPRNSVSGGIFMKSKSALAGEYVAPLFNGDDLFYDHTLGTTSNDKVFKVYANNDVIFEGFTIKNNGNNQGWHIKNAGNKLIIERLKFTDVGSIKGFGLESASSNNIFNNPVITGRKEQTITSYTGTITPADMDTAFALLGLDYSAGSGQPLFDIEGFAIINDYNSSVIPVNLAGPGLKTIDFLEKYMTSHLDLDKLSGLSFGGYLHVSGSNPFTGNSYSTTTPTLDGNLAVYLSSQGLGLKNLVIDDPDLYTSPTYIGGVGNVVLKGATWSNIDIGGSNGVVVSVDTPVKRLSNANNSNLWYVLDNNITSVPNTVNIHLANSVGQGILEIQNSEVNASNVRSADVGGSSAQAVIATGTQITALKTGDYGFLSFTNEYPDGLPLATWQSWASGNYDLTSSNVNE